MSFLQNTTLLRSTNHREITASKNTIALGRTQHEEKRTLRSRSSIATLVSWARNPVETIGEAFEGLRDGLTKEERAIKQCVEDKKQLLYLKMRNVSRVGMNKS